MKNLFKQEKAITLIALVITIIVLLILAGVTIVTLTGDNGLLGKTSESKFITEIQHYNEELKLAITEDYASSMGNRQNKFNVRRSSYNDEKSFTDAMKEKIQSFNNKYANKLEIKEDKLNYIGEDEQERTWLSQVISVAGILKISYIFENGTEAAPTYQRVISDGSYEVESPTIANYEPDQYIVSGEIQGDTNITVTYYGESQGLEYELLDDGTYTVAGIGGFNGKGLVIPAKFEGKSITQIKSKAFYNNQTIKSIIIPKTITKINSQCFAFMSNVESIYLNCNTICKDSIYYESNLINITVGENVEKIENWGIRNNSNLENLIVCSNKIDINGAQFVNSNIAKVIINKENTKYKVIEGVLYSKDGKKIYMYPSAKRGDFTIPSEVEEIGKCAFYYNKYLQEVIVPSTVNVIKDNAFENCDNISNININAKQIDGSVFYSMDKLEKIVFGKNVNKLGTWSIRNNSNLKEIYYLGTIEEWNEVNKSNQWKVNDNVEKINCVDGTINL